MNLLVSVIFLSLPATYQTTASEWRDRWVSEMDQIHTKPIDQQIERLGTAVRSKSTAGGWRPTDDQMFVASRALKMLLAIPSHAEFYRDRILAAQVEVKEHLDSADLGARLGRYTNEKTAGFETLKHVPSAETVRVLGEMLADDWTGGLELQENVRNSPLSTCAVVALGNLPIVSKPFPKTEGYQGHEQLEGWRQWYGEIKAGKRTYRFTDSNIEYGPDGPASPEQIEKARATRERDEKRAAGHARRTDKEAGDEKESETKKNSSPLPLLIAAALAVLVSIVWYVRRKKTAA